MSLGAEPLERAWREERAAVLATVARRLGDLQLAEDAVQEAFASAAARWPLDGTPERPGAWLTTTAWRKALDVLRRERHSAGDASTLLEPVYHEDVPGSDLHVEDDVLALVLTCCHPALAPEARVALTLRHVAGLSAREIAAAFLVPEPTMVKRLVRARAKIRDARISFALPDRDALPDRLAAVHAVIYVSFTEGHLSSGEGPAVRSELCEEAVWLARQLRALVPATRRPPGSSSCCCCRTRAPRRARTTRGSWFATPTRTSACGTTPRSPRRASCSRPPVTNPSGAISCRRRSRRCTSHRPQAATSTGRGSPTSTRSSRGSRRHRS